MVHFFVIDFKDQCGKRLQSLFCNLASFWTLAVSFCRKRTVFLLILVSAWPMHRIGPKPCYFLPCSSLLTTANFSDVRKSWRTSTDLFSLSFPVLEYFCHSCFGSHESGKIKSEGTFILSTWVCACVRVCVCVCVCVCLNGICSPSWRRLWLGVRSKALSWKVQRNSADLREPDNREDTCTSELVHTSLRCLGICSVCQQAPKSVLLPSGLKLTEAGNPSSWHAVSGTLFELTYTSECLHTDLMTRFEQLHAKSLLH